jgi:hypothetical protein
MDMSAQNPDGGSLEDNGDDLEPEYWDNLPPLEGMSHAESRRHSTPNRIT